MLRRISHLGLFIALTCLSLTAQIAEPILTKSAIPFLPGSASLKLDYAGGLGPSGGSSQVIPETTLEVGVYDRLEVLAKFPILRVTRPGEPATIGGGQLTMGARYLLAGGAQRSYALALQGVVEVPTGNTQLVGNATHLTPTLLAEWRPSGSIVFRSDLASDRAIGGTHPPSLFFEYSNAAGWLLTPRFVPQVELAGSKNVFGGRNQLVVQPELVFRASSRCELKAGVTFGLNSVTPKLGLKIQAAWFWGRRE